MVFIIICDKNFVRWLMVIFAFSDINDSYHYYVATLDLGQQKCCHSLESYYYFLKNRQNKDMI
jgi:hypothetical protein